MEDFSAEIIYYISSFLSVRSTIRLISTCKTFLNYYLNHEEWQKEIERKALFDLECITFKELLTFEDKSVEMSFVKVLQNLPINNSDFSFLNSRSNHKYEHQLKKSRLSNSIRRLAHNFPNYIQSQIFRETAL